jgi:hypothetical protein
MQRPSSYWGSKLTGAVSGLGVDLSFGYKCLNVQLVASTDRLFCVIRSQDELEVISIEIY